MPTLFDPITVRGTEIRNRIWIPALCQYSVLAEDGVPTDWQLVHLGAFARGGAGMVIAEATAIRPDGRISPRDTGIWNDEQVDAWRRITGFIASQGAVPAIQLAHAGRKASVWPEWDDDPAASRRTGTVPAADGGWPTVSASAIAFDDTLATPRPLARDELPQLVDDFRAAARRAVSAGFGAIELHAAHGYLLHQFLSPLSNRRDDEYGGSLENRARLLIEIVRAVRGEVGDRVPLLVRFSATDWTDGGWDVEQTATVARWAEEAGADLFDVSSGGLVPGVRIPVAPGYQVPLAEQVGEAGVETAAVGLIVEPAQAAELVGSGRVDAVLLGRAAMRDPNWPLRAARELGLPAAQRPAPGTPAVPGALWAPQVIRAIPRDGAPW